MPRPDLRFILAALMMPLVAQSADDKDEAVGDNAEAVDEHDASNTDNEADLDSECYDIIGHKNRTPRQLKYRLIVSHHYDRIPVEERWQSEMRANARSRAEANQDE